MEIKYNKDGSIKKKVGRKPGSGLFRKSKEEMDCIKKRSVVKFNVQIGSGLNRIITSVTLKKDIISLWLLLSDKYEDDNYKIVQEFIDTVCLKKWPKMAAAGLSDFIQKCMIHSFLEKEDFEEYKKIYLSFTKRF